MAQNQGKPKKESKVEPLVTFDLADLLKKDLGPEPPEEAYRRGYRDAMLVLWSDLLTISDDESNALEKFIDGPLLEWMRSDTSKKILPPEFGTESEYRSA
jgi:hypothetical protein